MDLPTAARIHRGKLADQSFSCHAAAQKRIPYVTVWHLLNIPQFQDAAIGHIHIRPPYSSKLPDPLFFQAITSQIQKAAYSNTVSLFRDGSWRSTS